MPFAGSNPKEFAPCLRRRLWRALLRCFPRTPVMWLMRPQQSASPSSRPWSSLRMSSSYQCGRDKGGRDQCWVWMTQTTGTAKATETGSHPREERMAVSAAPLRMLNARFLSRRGGQCEAHSRQEALQQGASGPNRPPARPPRPAATLPTHCLLFSSTGRPSSDCCCFKKVCSSCACTSSSSF